MNRLRLRAEGGFTLIELLVVIAIIGILAAIAIPQFAEYRKRGFEADARSAARNLATAQEGYFATNNDYASKVATLSGNYGFTQGANITATTSRLSATRFTLTARNTKCTSGGSVVFDSDSGAQTLTACN
jgi:prepilin-type N-terminal cleavage/methylation domain-containing protein